MEHNYEENEDDVHPALKQQTENLKVILRSWGVYRSMICWQLIMYMSKHSDI